MSDDILMSDDIFTRLMAERGISFPEAVEIVSEMVWPAMVTANIKSGKTFDFSHDTAGGTVSLVEKWLLREMIEDSRATPEIKTFLQDFAKRRDLDLTRS